MLVRFKTSSVAPSVEAGVVTKETSTKVVLLHNAAGGEQLHQQKQKGIGLCGQYSILWEPWP